MKITLNWLKKHGACRASLEMFAAQPERDAAAIIKLLIATNTDWANWLICRMLTRKQKIQFAVFAAEQVLPIFEAKYPNDNRPRLAIEAAKNVIDRNTIKNRSAAASCAADAADAASAAPAALADTYAAACARAVARARAAVYSDALVRAKMQTKIITYGLSLLEGEK